MNTHLTKASLLATAVLLAACGQQQNNDASPADAAQMPPGEPAAAPAEAAEAPVDAFMARIASHCGQAFAGRIISNTPPEGEAPPANDPFVGKALVMHVRECSPEQLRVPFHVGDDHSRTWVLTRTETGLQLKHDHRHEDGSDDALTMYGGDTATPGSAERQEFPVDVESIELFQREGLPASVTNTWAMEIEPNQRFLYELSRPTGRMFQVEFDLTTPVETPPAPWGSEDTAGEDSPGGY
jgi:hypothetical protein